MAKHSKEGRQSVSETRSSRSSRIAVVAVVFMAVLSFALVSCSTGSGVSDAQTVVSSETSSTEMGGGSHETTTTSLPSITSLRSSTTLPSSTGSSVGETGSGTTRPSLPAAKVVQHGPTDKKRIALTFDDNYEKATAFATLKVLEAYKVPATFFVIGHYVDTGPELARAIAKGGFEVGDHTRSHANCTKLSKRGLRIEIGNGTSHYHGLTGAPTVPLFRPPGGFLDQKTAEVAGEKGFRYVVMWDIDTNDWRGHTASQITENVMANAHNGAIVLMHVAAPHTAEALPNIIKRLRKAGYELVTVSTLLGM
jgi:peptidoglycan/xylan/chitin deacetylase (PgdA/CDA1 family)